MIVLCGCEAHQSDLAQCSCLCDEHDKHFDRGVVIVREALRHQASETYRLQQQMGNVTHRLRRVEDELSSSHNAWQPPSNEAVSSFVTGLSEASVRAMEESHRDLPPDMWDRYGLRWTAKRFEPSPRRTTPDVMWEAVVPMSGGRERIAQMLGSNLDALRGPLTETPPQSQESDDVHITDTDAGHSVERPITGNETTYWPPNPRESDDEHYFNATTRMRERAEAAEAQVAALTQDRDQWMLRAERAWQRGDFDAVDIIALREDKRRLEAEVENLTGMRGSTSLESEWEVVPLDAALDPDAQIRLTIVGPAGDGWDGTRTATDFMWDNEHSVTLEVLGCDGHVDAVTELCHAPMGPMVVGSTCPVCGHGAAVHSIDGGPCAQCALDATLERAQAALRTVEGGHSG